MLRVPLDLIYVNPDPLHAWPVTWGVPLAKGDVVDEASLSLHAPDGEPLPLQTRVLRRHADGSIARLLVHSEVDVPPEQTQAFELHSEGAARSDTPSRTQAVRGAGAGVAASDTNALTGGAGTLSLTDNTLALTNDAATFTFSLNAGVNGGDVTLTWQPFAVFEQGPLLSAAVVEAHSSVLNARLTIRMPRTQPVVFVDAAVLNLTDSEIDVDCVELSLSRDAPTWQSVTHEIRQVPSEQTSPPPVSLASKKLAIEVTHGSDMTRHERRLLNYNETWIALEGEAQSLHAGFRNFFELFPAGMDVSDSTLTFALYPRWAEKPWHLEPGRGKTHEVAIALIDPANESQVALTPRAFGYAFGKPPMSRVPVDHHEAVGSMTGLLPHMPDIYPRIETTLYDLTYNRNRGYGKMNWGDDYSVLYTNQLRGKGEIVWNNLEGDHPFHMWRQFVRTGRYIYFKEFRDSILHWADVDFCDKHSDPMKQGALTIHSADHTSGWASPCHNWAESFREWYFATGDPRPLHIIKQMADWLMRKADAGFFKTDPMPYVRGCGWGLIQMNAMLDVIDRDDVAALARDLSQRLLDYCRANDGLVMLLPTGGNWSKRDNAFHTATVVVGAFRHHERTGDALYRDLAIEAAQVFMDQRTCTPEGIAVYITGPEQDFPMQQAAGLTLAGLAVAYRLTGEDRYVRRGMRMLEYCLDRGMIVDHMRIPGEFITIGDDVILNIPQLMPNTQMLSYQLRGILLFMRAAHDAGMLKKIDYVF